MEKHLDISKKLSWYLRHNQKVVELFKKDENWNGEVSVDWILNELNINLNILKEIIDTDNKGRYSFNSDLTCIKANQGHSFYVNLGLTPTIPPKKLYHGTNNNVSDIIMKTGLKPMSRQYVHLSEDIETAKQVGSRRIGELIILEVDTEKMIDDGIKFLKSQNGVWLVEEVSNKYLNLFIK